MMIEDTRAKINQVADTYFKYEPARSKFLEDMEYNMKAYSGIDPSISSEEISKQRNAEQEQDLIAATENVLTQVDYNNPETLNSIMQNYRTYGTLLKSNPSTAIIESFVDSEVADKIFSNEVYRINATNTDQDYPLYMTRGAIFEEQLIDHLQNDNPSLYSFTKRFITPPALSMSSSLLKGSAGVFLAHGLTAAYDVSQLGDSIYNTQKKYIDWRNALLDDKTLTYDKFQEESKKLFDDIVTNVPEEYRYEIYKALREGADPFADGGLSFSGLGFETGIKPVSGTYRAAKGMINKVIPLNKSMNVKNMQFNEELGNKIAKMSTNKVDENVVDEIVEVKNTATKPAEVSPEMEDVVKGIIRNKEIDENLLQNSNNDRVLPGLSVSQEDIAAHNALTSGENRVQAVEEAFNKRQAINARRERAGQKGEIRLEEPEYSYFIDHGKGVDNLPMTYEEAVALQKKLQGRYMQYSPWKTGYSNNGKSYTLKPHWNPEVEPEYIAIQSASPEPFSKNPEKAGIWDYEGTQNKHTGDQWAMPGGYASSFDSPWVAAKGYYLTSNDKNGALEAREIIDKFYNKFLDDGKQEKAIEYFDKDGKLKQKIIDENPLISDDKNAINKKYNKALAARYAMVEFFKEHGAKESTIDRVVEASKKYGADYLLDSGNDLSEHIDILQHASREGVEQFKKSDKDIIKEFNAINNLYRQQQLYVKEGQIKAAESLNEPIKNRFTFLYQSVMNYEFEKHLKDMVSDPNFETKSKYLNTLGSINPMKHLDGMFYFDPNHGLIPFGAMFDRPKNDKYVQEWADSISKGFGSIDSIKKDIVNAIKKEGKLYKGKDVEWVGLPDNPEPWDVKDIYYYSKGENDAEFDKMVNRYVEENSLNFEEFQNMIARHLFPDVADDKDKLYPIFRKYLEDKGFKQVWHNLSGGAISQSFNVSIQDFNTITPVILEEKNLDRPWNVQRGYNNAHMIVSAGDGVGYFVRELHGVKGAKPMIIKSGKVVDFGDYKPYNSKK